MLITFMYPFNSLIIDNRVPNIIIDHTRHSSHAYRFSLDMYHLLHLLRFTIYILTLYRAFCVYVTGKILRDIPNISLFSIKNNDNDSSSNLFDALYHTFQDLIKLLYIYINVRAIFINI